MMYIFDIDGTLADLSHRLHFIQNKPADWRAFFAACSEDTPIREVILLAKEIALRHSIAIVSGRSDEVYEKTVEWLKRHHIEFSFLLMRKQGDHREDSVVKAELLDELLQHVSLRSIFGVFEDRKQVVDMYRSRGLRVFQVADGDF